MVGAADLSATALSRAAVHAGQPPASPGALSHLASAGYPIAIHFGVYKVREALRGHSWVTVDGRPVAGRMPPETLQAIDTFPVAGSHGSRTEVRFHPLHPNLPPRWGGLEGTLPPPVSR